VHSRARVFRDRNGFQSALTEEFKLGEDNSDPTKAHPELDCVTEIFSKRFWSRARECTYYCILQSDFSACPLNTNEDVNEWLNFFEYEAPLVAVGYLVSCDPVR